MFTHQIELDFIRIFKELSELPLRYPSKSDVMKRITELTRDALNSHACTLTFIDLENKYLIQVASAGIKEFDEYMTGRRTKLGSVQGGDFLDFDLIARGTLIQRDDLQVNGGGVANPKTAQRYNLASVLGQPLISEGRLIGYLNHFSSGTDAFTDRERELLEIFAYHAVQTIERFDYIQTRDQSWNVLNALSPSFRSKSEKEFLQLLSARLCELMSVPVCIAWQVDERRKKMRIVATAGDVDDAYKSIELSLDDPGIELHVSNPRVAYLSDVTKPHPMYKHSHQARARHWVSLLSAPMCVDDRLVGMIDIYTYATRSYKPWEKNFFGAFANHAALSIQKAELLRETQENLAKRAQLDRLTDVMFAMIGSRDVDELLRLLLESALELVDSERGGVTRYDFRTGELPIVSRNPVMLVPPRLKLGEGITGLALAKEEPIRVDDVVSNEWRGIYKEGWSDTRSELAVPIVVRNALIRVGRETQVGSKPIGVLNIESPRPQAFKQIDEDVLLLLASQAAIMIEQFEFDQKLDALRQVETELVGKQDWDDIIGIVMDGITETLGYDYVNISIVIPELNLIQSKYIRGIPRNEVEAFKKMAVHSLDSNDIQAHIVRSKAIEVPAKNDKRFDPDIYRRFGHDQLIRVYIPMIVSSDNRVIGTIEAGYRRSHRRHIYERDVQILKAFVDYTARMLEQREVGRLERIIHEFLTPIVGIRSNASFVERRFKDLTEDKIKRKFQDMLADCEILRQQVGELEHILGRPPSTSKPVETVVFRDIVVKTVHQLRSLVREQGFDPTRVEYNSSDIHKIKVFVDPARLSRVVFNLLTNSLKYAESDPSKFTVRISVDETRDLFIIRFKDWGIGIQKGYEERIFEDGVRTPEAVQKNVTGSGLGLTIARKIMREIGGDLRLVSTYKPTEFQMVIPKRLREAPNDSVRR